MNLDILSDHLIRERVLRHPLVLLGSVGGGCINQCYKVRSGEGHYFLKVNDASAFPAMFEKEARGLDLLRGSTELIVPKVIRQADVGNISFLMMEFIESGRRRDDYWSSCGRLLAKMHRRTADAFGLDHSNYIGSLVQHNDFRTRWEEFYLDCRLVPQLEMGIQYGWADRRHFSQAEAVARVIESEFPEEVPSILHGDLWGGNLMTDLNGKAVLVDPAVYYGNREMELAFTRLFGGFRGAFYEHYEDEYPVQPDFSARMEIHNLYPLMVHANLFGGHYVQEVLRILRRHST